MSKAHPGLPPDLELNFDLSLAPASAAARVRAALACLNAFTDRFNARDAAGLDALLHFPHLMLCGEEMLIWASPGRLADNFFDDLATSTGWHHTSWLRQQAVLVAPRKVHLMVEYARNRADGSIISRHENLWIVSYDCGRWGIKLRSY